MHGQQHQNENNRILVSSVVHVWNASKLSFLIFITNGQTPYYPWAPTYASVNSEQQSASTSEQCVHHFRELINVLKPNSSRFGSSSRELLIVWKRVRVLWRFCELQKKCYELCFPNPQGDTCFCSGLIQGVE